jgi:hypothetical protein
VPKNWKTFRTIACEPDGALPFQLAFDTFAKRRLRARGINLSDQSRNQLLAKEGSINGSLATIDLSSASDTVAFNTVALLFPTEWFDVLNAFRSTHWRSKLSVTEVTRSFLPWEMEAPSPLRQLFSLQLAGQSVRASFRSMVMISS